MADELFGDEWREYTLRMSKNDIVTLYRRVCIENLHLRGEGGAIRNAFLEVSGWLSDETARQVLDDLRGVGGEAADLFCSAIDERWQAGDNIMAKNSKIEWCDHTFNPWIGCAKVSAGCAHCYAERMAKRYGWVAWGENGTRKRTSAANWRKPLRWNAQKYGECTYCGWRGEMKARCPVCDTSLVETRQRVFVASLADVFEERTELLAWRADLFALIKNTPNLDWLILTKRPQNINRMVLTLPKNVWIGTTVENQQTADERIPALLSISASVRFLSMEPLLGAVNLGLAGIVPKTVSIHYRNVGEMISWIIVGGETGPKARPMHPAWARSLRDQCLEAEIPFFFKSWGAWHGYFKPVGLPKNVKTYNWKDGYISARYGKKITGSVLDGRLWRKFPAR